MADVLNLMKLPWIDRVNMAIEWRKNEVSYRVIANKLKISRETLIK